MKTYPQIRRALAGKLWYVHEEKMQEMLAFLEIKLAGGSTAPEVLESIRASNQAAAARAQKASGPGAIAVIPIYGLIMHRQMEDISGGSSGTSTMRISAALRQAIDDPGVSSIVLDIDSPGGDCDGVDELASEIYAARKQKKITAVSNCLCASAAYYLASQASEIVVSPSSLTGSIGVYTMHEDDSAMFEQMGIKLELIKFGENKAETLSIGPLSDSARAHLQQMVNVYGVAFEKAVARGRKIKQDEVHSKFGQGRVFDAKTAVNIGMADRVGTLADVLGSLAGSSSKSSARATDNPQITSDVRKLEKAHGRWNGPCRGGCETELWGTASPYCEECTAQGKDPVMVAGRARKADVGPDDCSCDCDPCGDGDCDGCNCGDCACEGCACETAAAKIKAADLAKMRARDFARMRHQLAIAQ